MSNPHNIKPGDTLYVVRNRREARNIRVGKVGRKWITLDIGDRVDLETLAIDGGDYTSPGQCYLSLEHYKHEQRRAVAWRDLCNCVNRFDRPPSRLTTEAIERVLGELGGSKHFRERNW